MPAPIYFVTHQRFLQRCAVTSVLRAALVVLALWALVVPSPAKAEPWLGSRFARNCAGCHAPHRFNLPAPQRRCALSCQGCHVNPSGGGLRNYYGRWNSDRWLRSFRSSFLRHDKAFAPFKQQTYGKRPLKKLSAKKLAVFAKEGFRLVEMKGTQMREGAYFQPKEEYITVPNKAQFLYRIPEKDPYRTIMQQRIDGGMDLRWLWQSRTMDLKEAGGPATKVEGWANFMMNADFGLRLRPAYRYVHLVHEARFMGSPHAKPKDIVPSSRTRSLYLMVDEIPFNIHVMAGYYRPLFGNATPDHTALGQKMAAFAMSNGKASAQRLVFRSLSFGTAPNLPYANVHIINEQLGIADDQTKGFAVNLGLRGVRFGQSLNYSYWRTRDEQVDRTVRSELHSINAMVMLGPTVFSYEGISMALDNPLADFRQGGVHSVETYSKLWREFYAITSFAYANTNPALLPGKGLQFKIGGRAFLIPGFELQLTYDYEDITTDSAAGASVSTSKAVTMQAHAFM